MTTVTMIVQAIEAVTTNGDTHDCVEIGDNAIKSGCIAGVAAA